MNHDIISEQHSKLSMEVGITDLGTYFGSAYHRTESLVVIICVVGEQFLNIGGKDITLMANEALICPFGSFLSNFSHADDTQLMVMGLAPDMINHTFFTDSNFWRYVNFIYSQKVVRVPQEVVMLFRHYGSVFDYHQKHQDGKFHKDIMSFLNSGLFYELMSLIAQSLTSLEDTSSFGHTQPVVIFKDFVTLLGQNKGRKHKVRDFADALCISPKYLSSITKGVCKKSPKQMIDEEVANVIKQQLLYSNKSVKEIANDLNFPNLSFFGKFTKDHLGASPLNIRQGSKK